MTYDAIVLGGGAAGLFCAAQAGRLGRRVALIEHSDRPGRKILISGGGRANFTNLRVEPRNFLSANPHFAKSALARFTPQHFLDLMRAHRIPYHEKTLGQLFCDRSAQDLLTLLLTECSAGKVELHASTKITAVTRDTRFRVETSRGTMEATTLVVATGGLSIPKTGASGFGYDLARQFGLTIEKPYPALVPLTFDKADQARWGELSGVSTGVVATHGKQHFCERMLYTHRGLSGPAILQISSYWKPGSPLNLDLLPGTDFSTTAPHEARKQLSLKLPQRLAERWLEVEGFTQPVPSVKKIDTRLHHWSLVPAGTEGFDKAEVTGGGVSTAELSSQTMEARQVPGLFFIGEVVDVTGWLGGYNFQWAWASAYAAAQAITGSM
ncbi:NAD(P)/FAD-dependent oxidoreductase [uncultured Paludibaculum sp.]|uniref:NAD(P)/FAD-dependent oxidoreductase n=1 Tax=uncultured Paludibaculum sp. TaxID=1765020 RepID=UPI002AAC0890|nr:NAD(P)/FAD-dependent oxidoreductase [uncultured Paludibaculum sp.]